MTWRYADQVRDLYKHGADFAKAVRSLSTIEPLGVPVQVKETPRIVQRRIERRVCRLVAHEEGEGKRRFGVGG